MKISSFNELEFFSVCNANVLSGSSIIYSQDFQEGYTTTPFVPDKQWLAEEIASRLHREEIDGVFEFNFTSAPQCAGNIPSTVIPFNTLHSENYFHFLIESLPSLLMLYVNGFLDKESLIVTGRLHPNMVEAMNLTLSGMPVSVLQLDLMKYVLCDKVIGTPDSFYVAEQIDGLLSPITYRALNLKLFRELFKKFWSDNISRSSVKIFIDRKSNYRLLANKDELAMIAKKAGYTVIDPGQLSFVDQIRLFSSASHICGPSGAWAANIIFAPDDAKITILSPATIKPPSLWVGLGNAIDLVVLDVAGPVTRVHPRQPIHSDFIIPKNVFSSLL